MKPEQLERALREAEPPDAGPARERARRTVLAAHAQRRSRRRVRRVAPLVYAALAAVLAALVVTQRDSGPVQAIERRARAIVRAPEPTPTPAAPLPAGGRLLVSGANGLDVLDGSRRTKLGDYDDATWSPRGFYVGADGRPVARRAEPEERRAALAPDSPAARSVSRAGRRTGSTSPTGRTAPCGSSTATASTTSSPGATWRTSPPRGARMSRAPSPGRTPAAPSRSRTPTRPRCCGPTAAAACATSRGPPTAASC